MFEMTPYPWKPVGVVVHNHKAILHRHGNQLVVPLGCQADTCRIVVCRYTVHKRRLGLASTQPLLQCIDLRAGAHGVHTASMHRYAFTHP